MNAFIERPNDNTLGKATEALDRVTEALGMQNNDSTTNPYGESTSIASDNPGKVIQIVGDALNKVKQMVNNLINKLKTEAVKRALDAVVAGAGAAIETAQKVARALGLGKLADKLDEVMVRIFDIFVIAGVGILVIMTILPIMMLLLLVSPQKARGSDTWWPPDESKGFEYIDTTKAGGNQININPGNYVPNSNNTCFFGNGETLYCSQGPYGDYSHNCSSNGNTKLSTDLSYLGPIYAPEDGTVTTISDMPCTCNRITYSSRGGYIFFTSATTRYELFHTTPVNGVKVGSRLKKGELLAVVTPRLPDGGTNCCWEGPHAHISVYRNGTYLNSLRYLIEERGCPLSSTRGGKQDNACNNDNKCVQK